MGRKNLLIDLDEKQLTAVNPTPGSLADPRGKTVNPTLGARGAVGAMSRSLEIISAERVVAKALSESIASGQNVVEINTGLIDSSIVPDRMLGADVDHNALVESIRNEGQLVPVLLRPHPTKDGRFQVAYGHRRLRALQALDRPVRAVVRQLSDDELVVAQGKENSDRKDLSYIERGRFAATLEDRRFGRETIMAALNVDKTELSRMISVARAIPSKIVERIGPAPKTGRRRWMELAERLEARGANQESANIIEGARFSAANSDDRFALLFAAVAPRQARSPKPAMWCGMDGKKVARIERRFDRVTVSVDEKIAPRFGEYLIDKLPDLYRAFRERRD
jgi:ParB family transcriptional regulator, chromosome partitioning protein